MAEKDYFAFKYEAMTAPWEILVDAEGQDEKYAGQAAAAAFAEVDVVEGALSRFRDTSDVARINAARGGTAVRVGLHTMQCLQAAGKAHADTGGLFDVTVGPLILAWRNADKTPRTPSMEELAAARARVGMDLLELDGKNMTVTPKVDGVTVDLGGIGKGYAGDVACGLLREWGIERALVSAGTSTVVAMDAPQGKEGWPIGVGGVGAEPESPYTLALKNEALSGSGEFAKGSHIIDPRKGRPVTGRLSAWSLCGEGAMADALSTAFVIMEREKIRALVEAREGVSAMIAESRGKEIVRERFGEWPGLEARPPDS